MKIRITDLLDEYLDDDLPLDAMPDILPGDRPKQKPNRAAHRLSHRKHAGQIVAAVLIVASVTAVGGFKLLCGGSAGKSLAAMPAEMDSAVSYTPEPTAAVTPAPESTDDAVLEDGGYFASTITVDGEDVNVSAGNLTRSGSTFTLTVSWKTSRDSFCRIIKYIWCSLTAQQWSRLLRQKPRIWRIPLSGTRSIPLMIFRRKRRWKLLRCTFRFDL